MRILTKLVAWMFLIRAGQCANVTLEAGPSFYQPGSELKMDCAAVLAPGETFTAWSPTWQKCQDVHHKDKGSTDPNYCWIDITSGASIVGVFEETGRFQLKVEEDLENIKRIDYKLTVSNLDVVDSGIYRCLFTPSTDVITYKAHEVFVYRPIESVSMTTGSDASLTERLTDETQVTFIQGTNGYLECRSIGGYPKPVMKVTAAEELLNGQLEIAATYTLTDPEGQDEGDSKRGLQIINHDVRLMTSGVTFNENDNDKMVLCRAEVHGENGNIEDQKMHQSQLSIHFAPKINCSKVYYTMPGRQNFKIRCPILSRPAVEKIKFVYKGTKSDPITPNEPKKNFEVTVEYDPENQEHAFATLTIQDMQPEYFKEYQLEAENTLGNRKGRTMVEFKIKQGDETDTDGSTSQAAVVTPMVILSFVLALVSLAL